MTGGALLVQIYETGMRTVKRDTVDRLLRYPLMCDSCDWQYVLSVLLFSLMLLRGITVSCTHVGHPV